MYITANVTPFQRWPYLKNLHKIKVMVLHLTGGESGLNSGSTLEGVNRADVWHIHHILHYCFLVLLSLLKQAFNQNINISAY